jgi:hypothetical protein
VLKASPLNQIPIAARGPFDELINQAGELVMMFKVDIIAKRSPAS